MSMSGTFRDPRAGGSTRHSSSYGSSGGALTPPGFQQQQRSTPPPHHPTHHQPHHPSPTTSSMMAAAARSSPTTRSTGLGGTPSSSQHILPHPHHQYPGGGGGVVSSSHRMAIYNEEEEMMARRDAAELFNQMGSLSEENAALKRELELATDIIRALRMDNAELTTKVATLESSGMASSVTASIRNRAAATASAHSSSPQRHHHDATPPSTSSGYNVALSTPASLSRNAAFPPSQQQQHRVSSPYSSSPHDYILPPTPQQQTPTTTPTPTTNTRPSHGGSSGGFLGSGGSGVSGYRAGPNIDALQKEQRTSSHLSTGNPDTSAYYHQVGGRSTSAVSGGGASSNTSSPVRVRPLDPSAVPTSALTNSLLLANRRRLQQHAGVEDLGSGVDAAVVPSMPSGTGGYFGRGGSGVGSDMPSSSDVPSGAGRAPPRNTTAPRPDFGDSNTTTFGGVGTGNVSRSYSATSLLNMLHGVPSTSS